MDQDELIDKVRIRIKGLAQHLGEDDFESAVEDAMGELGWSLPTSDDFQIHWFKLRASRHLISYFLTESASKFDVDNIKLAQRFKNLKELIVKMDEDFIQARVDFPEKFTDLDPAELAFGTRIPAGFKNDWLGRDITYK